MTVEVHTLPTRLADCLKLCYLLRERGEPLSTHVVFLHLRTREPEGQLSRSVVTRAFEQLHALGYVSHTRYHGVELTEAGERAAAELVRHQRLLELFLFRLLGLPLDQVHAEAERLEHALSEVLEDHIDAVLGHPTEDPHGDPIPDMLGQVHTPPSVLLSTIAAGQQVRIQRLAVRDADLFRYLEELGLVPGSVVSVESKTSYGDVLTVRLSERSIPLGTRIAEQVQVQVLDKPRATPESHP